MTSDEKLTTSCETGSHYEGDFSYFSHMEKPSDQEGPASITCPECEKDVYVYHFEWTALKCQHCGAVVEKDSWNREGTYDYYLRRMKEENALKKQVGGDH